MFRLSTQQKHLWLLQQGEPRSPYRTQCAVLIEGILNIEILKSALDSVVNRNEILRTTFKSLPGQLIPFQVITDSNLPVIFPQDLSALTASEQTAKIEAIFQNIGLLPFDFTQTPTLDVSLIILSSDKHLLFLSLPSLCADSLTLRNLVHEISCYYEGLAKVQLRSETMQYADYSEWQHELLTAEDTKIGREYWKKQDISAVYNLKLPFENKSAKSKEFQPKSFAITIQAPTVVKLKTLAQRYNTSISVCLQAIWHILLWRLTGESNLIVGTAYNGRQYEELQESLGLFAKYLPIRSNLKEKLQFSEVLEQIHEAINKQYKWQNYFSWAEVGGLNSNDQNIPWFPVSYNFEEHQDEYFTNNLVFNIYKQFTCIDKLKLNLFCLLKRNSEIIVDFYYDSSLFKVEDVKCWAGQFNTLLESVIENPLSVISKLKIISEFERQKLLFEFNNTKTNYSKIQCVHQLFEKQADSTPDRVALVFENQQLTYAQLNQSANQLAHYLQDLGVGPEVLVAICMERSLLTVIALLAILKAGGAYVPIDPQLPQERQSLILKDTQAIVVLANKSSASNLPKHRVRLVSLDADWDVIAQKSSENCLSEVTPENLVYVLYTSGSTGKPKGVAVEHQQLFNYLNGILAQLNLPDDASFALVSTFAADLGNTVIFPALCTGGCLHVISSERASDADRLADYYRDWGGIDCLKIVPTHLQALLNSCRNPSQIIARRLVLGGEPLSWNLVEKVQALAPDCTILNHYGPTEATVGVLTYQVENGRNYYHSATVPLGRPLPNTQIFVLDEHLLPAPIGVPGELYIGGTNLTRGYLNHPDLTKEKFIPNPFEEVAGERLYKTGDLVRYLSDGNIEFLGRIDHQVKIRGFRIELGEIETALRQHPAVRETVVIALEDERDERRLVAYVVPDQKQTSTNSELISFLQKLLPDYMMPSCFVMLDALPLMLNGKLDRCALPAPDWRCPKLEASFIAPRTPEEKLLADIWAEVLGVERVGVQNNFFELGGDSILSIQIVARAKGAGLFLTPMQLFQHQTIAELTAVANKTYNIQIEQGLVTGEVPLTPIQHWFFEQNLPSPHHWNMSILLETPPNVNFNWLVQVIEHLNQHHDSLRLRFKRVGTSWQQIYISDNIAPLSWIDLSNRGAPEQASAIETEVAKMQATLNLSTTLMRVVVFHLGNNQPGRLAIIIHHLVMDGISWRIWLEDFHRAYQQLSQGAAIQLSAKTTSFQHWAERLSAYAQSTALQQELNYWLNNSSHQSRLPRDHFYQPNIVASARTVSVSLSIEDTQTLLQEVPAVYKTQINDLFLTSLALAFRQWTGENTLLLELEGHGREALFNDVDLSRTIGWFTTHFPVLLDLSLNCGEATSNVENGKKSQAIGLALKSVKEQLRQIPNRGIGYGLLRYLSGNPEVTKKLQAFPEAEVSFNYLGRFSQVLPQSTPFRLVKESTVSERSLQGKRTHLIAIDAIVLDGKLQLSWTYSENVHKRSTIANLVENFIAALKEIIRHCLAARSCYTPSDFPLAKLNQQQIDRLGAKFAIKDVYCLSPLQQGLLFHSLYAPNSRMYFQQKIFTLHGKLHIQAFQQAWQQVVNRHPSLRTIFIWEELANPLQVVLEQVKIPWEMSNWCQVSAKEQEQQLLAYLQTDLQQGFSLSDIPPMRLALIQTATDTHQLIWSHHHLLLDGWCNSIILKEVFNFYAALCEGYDLYLDDVCPYRDYIAWLQQRDWREAEIFWRKALSGLRAPTNLAVNAANSLPNDEQGYTQEQIYLSTKVTSLLQSFARQHHLTLNTLIQGAWALLLSRYSGEEDVVFGITVSGRPPELSGVEAIVGLLINTLPMRVQVSPYVSLLSLFQQLQQQQTEMLQYQHSSLVQIQEWSEIPRGTPLFDSFVTFENYPVDVSLREQNGSLKILNVRFFFETNYPLSVTVEPGAELLIRIDYFPNRFDADTIRRILQQLQTVLENIPVNIAHPLSDIFLATETTAVESQQLVNSFNTDLE